AGTVLGQGRLLQLEGLPGTAGLPTTGPEVERAVSRILDLLERLSAPRYAGLGQLVLTPSVEEMTSAGARPADALAAVRLVAEAAPRRAEWRVRSTSGRDRPHGVDVGIVLAGAREVRREVPLPLLVPLRLPGVEGVPARPSEVGVLSQELPRQSR